MNYNSKAVAVQSIPTLCENNTYDFTHPVQRSVGQWNKMQKSDLIDSLFRNIPIDAVTLAKEGKKFFVIDGTQRISTIRDFANGKLKLSDKLDDLPDGSSIAGKVFDELTEEQKDYFNTRNIDTIQLTDYTEEDIIEVFRRKNNGKPLTAAQKSSVNYSPELYNTIREITNLDQVNEKGRPVKNFWNRTITKGIRKNSEDRNMVMQSIMLIDKNMNDQDGLKCGFQAADINAYIDIFQSYSEEEQNILIGRIKEATEELNKQFTNIDKQIKENRKLAKDADGVGGDGSVYTDVIKRLKNRMKNIKKLTIPMIVAGMSRTLTNKAGVNSYMNNVFELLDFLAEMSSKTKEERDFEMSIYSQGSDNSKDIKMEYYKHYNTSGTASKDNVNGRWKVFRTFYKK